MALYDRLMQTALGVRWLRVYYADPSDFIRQVSRKSLHLTPEQQERAAREGLVPIIGREAAHSMAKGLIRRHALNAGIVTLLCSLPQNWVMWPLFAVDVVFFQKEVFVMTQELEFVYGRTTEGRDYSTLAALAVKLGGTQLKHKAIGWVKRGAGKGARMGLEYGVRVFRGSLMSVVRQALKWAGVVVARGTIEFIIDALLVITTSFIAGLVSYWLFVPMGGRLLGELAEEESRPNTQT